MSSKRKRNIKKINALKFWEIIDVYNPGNTVIEGNIVTSTGECLQSSSLGISQEFGPNQQGTTWMLHHGQSLISHETNI